MYDYNLGVQDYVFSGNFMFLASMLQVENKYGDLTILCLEHPIPLHKL